MASPSILWTCTQTTWYLLQNTGITHRAAPPVGSRVNNKDQVKSMATMILGRANLSSVCEVLGIASVKVLNPVQACFLRQCTGACANVVYYTTCTL